MKHVISKTSKAIVSSLIIGAALAGCAVGPDYVAPETKLAPFHNKDAVASRQTTLAAPKLDNWWTGFNDPMLATVVQRALDQNLDLQASIARVAQARAWDR
jgi:outer membrane protein TolC